ncbi:MAG: 3-oxoacyl-ACP reductase [Pelagibacterales bacterium]|nr:3-oxoacyl-ACP reductase [Pelagibacterales bacterium]OUU61805.1 MAG: 3-oxoacyl-ACP reductase [Alphaproteobacteria bacterium TMED62]|tara:strand:- start:5435 stop:6187 length:753 start_codon:yes stop_codon:yes gene_type:complete
MRLKNKIAIVTGGASGFGKGIVERFVKEGAKVVIADVNYEAAKALQCITGESTIAVNVDVSKKNEVDKMIEVTLKHFSEINILVQNAAIGMKPQSLLDTSEELFDRLFAVNVKSVYLGAKALIPILKKQGKGGVILNTVSTAALRPRPGLTIYNSTKGALIPMTKALALEVAEYRIRVNGICPVAGETPMLKDFLGSVNPEENHKKFISTIPLGRLAEPEDVANAALYLCSEEANFITGVMLEIDGGRVI